MARPSANADERVRRQLAGIGDEPDHRSRGWLRPSSVTLSAGLLSFDFDDSTDLVTPSRTLLDRFLRIRDERGALDYARSWGPLELCEDGLVYTHNPLRLRPGATMRPTKEGDGVDQIAAFLEVADGCKPLWWASGEPVATWISLAAQFRALLDVAANLHRPNPKPGNPADWRIAAPYIDQSLGVAFTTPGARVSTDRLFFTEVAEGYLRDTGIALTFRWDAEKPEPTFDVVPRRLFDALVLRLLAQAGRTDGVARCSACGNFFTQRRRPPRGTRTYCEPCREAGKPKRDAERDYAQRQRDKANKERRP
jgi:hypothetical protein